jgi:hypothetical protein
MCKYPATVADLTTVSEYTHGFCASMWVLFETRPQFAVSMLMHLHLTFRLQYTIQTALMKHYAGSYSNRASAKRNYALWARPT